MKLLIRNLSRSTTEHDLRALFSPFGTLAECTLVLDQKTGKSKGFAFIEMPNSSQAEKAIKALNMSVLDKFTIRVKKSV